jgi:hypothetical protein
MEWLKLIKDKFILNSKLIISSFQIRGQTIYTERLNLWFNSFYSYCKSQPILSLTCLILFFCLILMLLIYRCRRRRDNHSFVDRKRLEEITIKKQLKKTKSTQSNKLIHTNEEESTKGKIINKMKRLSNLKMKNI